MDLSLSKLWEIGFVWLSQMVKRLSAMQETQVQSLGWEDLLEEVMATHSSTLPWQAAVHRVAGS